MIYQDMYYAFRHEIDYYCVEKMRNWAESDGVYTEIKDGNETIGFLMVIDGYIEGAWVKSEYRRRGLMRKAVLDYVKEKGLPRTLHIVRGNKTALKFWKSIFDLTVIEDNPVDKLYMIRGIKDDKTAL